MKKKKVFIVHNCCQRRALDVSRLVNYFELNDCDILSDPEGSDYIIFVTCAFIKNKEEECIRVINKLSNYGGEFIIAGCLPATSGERFTQIFKGKSIITKDLSEIDKSFEEFRVKFSSIPDGHLVHSQFYINEHPFLMYTSLTNKYMRSILKKIIKNTRQLLFRNPIYSNSCFLRVCYGCLGKCTYCLIRNAIGSLKSKALGVCLDEYKQLLDKGYRQFMILADDVGAYGLDIGSSLPELISQLSAVDRGLNTKWHIQHLNPKWVVCYKPALLERIREGKIIEISSAIQSGSNRILRLMNRYDNSEKTMETLIEFKKANANLSLSTNIIVGFPSETESDLFATLNFIKNVRFNHVYIFSYYENEQVTSFNLNNKIDNKTKNKRIKIAISVLKKEKIDFTLDNNLLHNKHNWLWMIKRIIKAI